MGAGLGGGSSNAATTLLALNKLWQLNLSLSQLAELGLQLGADVPIFLHGQSAWAQGVGEDIHPLVREPQHYLVVYPGCQVSTAKVFSHSRLTRDSHPLKIARFPDRMWRGKPSRNGSEL